MSKLPPAGRSKEIVEHCSLRAVRQLGSSTPGTSSKKVMPVRGRSVRHLHAVLFALQVGDFRADPDRQEIFPQWSWKRRRRAGPSISYE